MTAFVDDVAVERACAGDRRVRLTADELSAAWRRLEAAGMSADWIADRLGVSERTVTRWRSGAQTPGARGLR